MARRRMVSKSISTSVKLSRVSDFAALLFTWIIPHTDDYGSMDGEPIAIKGIVVPMREKSDEDIETAMQQLIGQGLISMHKDGDRKFIKIVGFNDHQTFRPDRDRISKFPESGGMTKTRQRHTKDIPKTVFDSGIKVHYAKLTSSVIYLSKIPKEDMAEFITRFIATEKEIKGKAEDLKLYCESKGRTYKNYRSFLLNALKKDFKERKKGEFDKFR